jgi:DNA invertase Pin-like site-specific DNA recombinase
MKITAYYRVSTKRQGESGLGLEAQKDAVHRMARSNDWTIIAEFIEVETGKTADRPQLQAAIRHAKLTNSTLVVAKLDRLARNAAFTLTLQASGLPFICCDNPHANELTIGILAVIAQYEAKQISDRTRVALQAAKARGVKLGSAREGHWEGREESRSAGLAKATERAAKTNSEAFQAYYSDVLAPEMHRRRQNGESLNSIVRWLNASGFRTRRGNAFTRPAVSEILNRCVPQTV